MLKLEEIYYNIRGKKILQNIHLQFEPGKIHMILGPNGSGKTSLLKIASGQIDTYQGRVLYEQKSIREIDLSELAKYRGYLSQQNNIPFPLKVSELVSMGRYPHFEFQPSKKDNEIVQEVSEKLAIQHLSQRDYTTLSGGEQQRVQFARVLAQIWESNAATNRYLFLDEPLNNLDIQFQKYLLETIRSLITSNLVVIMIVHDINWALAYANEVYFMKEGHLVANGNPLHIINEELMQRVFDIQCKIVQVPGQSNPVVVY
jgi:iron complex transport system ATP-binding protein